MPVLVPKNRSIFDLQIAYSMLSIYTILQYSIAWILDTLKSGQKCPFLCPKIGLFLTYRQHILCYLAILYYSIVQRDFRYSKIRVKKDHFVTNKLAQKLVYFDPQIAYSMLSIYTILYCSIVQYSIVYSLSYGQAIYYTFPLPFPLHEPPNVNGE